ncbi:hypothetical protein RND71_043834 [Anisodus tanguticus]|uniref:Integrase catalytic domain-containing protein n=1 Tax=Anisodus tanguticus TaxID=243964 RepID=A0AAE1UNQ6_9SOLA|nr:hypothetical protein RND71_043834 [Anisodus tanguticus]
MLLKIGIKRELSCVHTPLQNGVSERKHRHIVIVEMALTLMINNGVPKHLWVEAFTTAVYLINRLPFSVINMQSPFSSLYGRDTFQGEITTLSETSDWGGRHLLVGDHRRQEWHSRKASSCHTPFQ